MNEIVEALTDLMSEKREYKQEFERACENYRGYMVCRGKLDDAESRFESALNAHIDERIDDAIRLHVAHEHAD